MGMDAELICFGPKKVLALTECLDYPDEYYSDVNDNAIVTGTIAFANTTNQSKLLAEICNVEPWDLGNHRITSMSNDFFANEMIGEDRVAEIRDKLAELLRHPEVAIWYKPNG